MLFDVLFLHESWYIRGWFYQNLAIQTLRKRGWTAIVTDEMIQHACMICQVHTHISMFNHENTHFRAKNAWSCPPVFLYRSSAGSPKENRANFDLVKLCSACGISKTRVLYTSRNTQTQTQLQVQTVSLLQGVSEKIVPTIKFQIL